MPKTLKSNPYFIDFGEVRLPVIVRKHPTSRRLVLRYQPLRGSIMLTIPRYVSIKQGLHFVNEKHAWLYEQVMQFSHARAFADGVILPVLGRNLRLKHVGGRGLVAEQGDELHVFGEAEFMSRRVGDFLKKTLRAEIQNLAPHYAKILGVKLGDITLRDTSSRWGSCSADGNLSFSWRLIFAPREVLEYVVAHEVAHIKEHNHSPEFWAVVESLYPNWLQHRDWLKTNGSQLYYFG